MSSTTISAAGMRVPSARPASAINQRLPRAAGLVTRPRRLRRQRTPQLVASSSAWRWGKPAGETRVHPSPSLAHHSSFERRTCRRSAVVVSSAAAAAAAPGEANGGDSGENAAVVNTIKAIFGAGGFALPWAFAQGGTVLVTACLACSYVLALQSLKMLVKAQEVLVDGKIVAGQGDVQTYAKLTKAAVGDAGDVLCKVLNVVTCFGISISYILFVSDTLISMLPAATAATFTTARMVNYSTALWVALSWVRDFKGVNLISLVGTISVTLGMIWCTVVALSNPLQMAAIPASNPAAFSSFFGTVAFLFFIHFTLFGVQEAMPQPKRFIPAVSKAFGLSMIVSLFFGVVGAWGFGPESVVITMLSGAPGLAVKALLCVNLLFTFPLMARSALVIVEDTVKGSKEELATPMSLALRSAFVVLAAFVGTNVPDFGKVLGLVGGVCCSAMSVTMPPWILANAMKKAGLAVEGGEKAKMGFVFAVGVVCMILSVVL